MKPQRSTSAERTPTGNGPAAPEASPLCDGPSRLESAVVLGILLIGLASCLILYGHQILAMLGVLGHALGGGR
jgi:hypothetical protein